ncbi:ribonucleotide reductase [Halovirus HCTV-5]|uniref:ribonucleotide reductase n=1 Tax=Halovirus HCTV-5 TaxID=1273748 RepID=UPI0003348C3B|nr:ribonucleotide reductase [Halovirus HCTV-5]AGM11635.1 ribonucleotide reductase [Halovirus HCTV-5]
MPQEELAVEDVVLPPKRQDEPTLEARMSENAYNRILPSRYQRRDADGELVEEQEEVFERVAKNIALGDVPHMEGIIEVGPSEYRPEFLDEFPDGETQVEVTEDNARYLDYDSVSEVLAPEARRDLESTKDEFQDLMEHLSFMPNTPTLINAGDELQQLSACFVDSPADDMDDIHDTAREAAKIFQSGGGMGYAFWKLRPYGDKVGSTGGIASGPITFMRTYDQMCKTIAQGGTRRGAQMGVMKVSHPDAIEFIHAKNKDVSLAVALGLNDPKDPTNNSFREALDEARDLIEDGKVPKHLRNAVERHLSNFNISVGVTEDFMEALEQKEEFTFTNPRTDEPHIATQETKELWSRYDLGHHVSVGEPLSVPAEEVWERIIEGAYENGEPGVIFLDRVNEEHSFDVEKHPDHEILATNPCGEQPLEEYEACNLGHINLSTLAAKDAPDWREYDGDVDAFLSDAIDWEEFDRRIYEGTHFLDNVVTMSNFPIPEIEEKVTSMRKIGLGIMGYAQLLIQLGIPYGSDLGNDVARRLMQYINHESKAESHHLAQERGAFDEWDKSKYANPTEYPSWFEEHTGENSFDWEDGFPVRNHNTTTIAPTGTTSMIGNTSGGCEPLHNVAFLKNVSQDIQGEDELVEFDDYFLRVLEANEIDVQAVKRQAARQMQDPSLEFKGTDSLDEVPDSIGSLFVTTGQLSGREHASVQCAFQEGVDSAISKTVNFPSTATRGDVREVYEYIYEHGGKGVTVYVDGSRQKSVISTSSNSADEEDTGTEEPQSTQETTQTTKQVADDFLNDEYGVSVEWLDAVMNDEEVPTTGTPRPRERPKVLDSTVYPVSTGYGELNVFVNEDNAGEPFEVFAEIGKSGGFTHSFTEAIGRLTSLALRSGIPVDEVVDQLDGIRSPKTGWHNGGHQIQSIPDAVAYALEQHTEEPESEPANPTPDTTQLPVQNGNQQESEGGALAHGENPECTECGAMALTYSEGCKTCSACGWSECG